MNIEKELCLNNFKNIELFSLVEPESWSPISLEFLQVNLKKYIFLIYNFSAEKIMLPLFGTSLGNI